MEDFFRIYNKSYRLVSAVFIVIKEVENENELKTRIKVLSLSLVSSCAHLKDFFSKNKNQTLSEIEVNVLELISLFDVALTAGVISEMNGNILKKEFEVFLSQLRSYSENIQSKDGSSIQNIFKNETKDSLLDGTKASLVLTEQTPIFKTNDLKDNIKEQKRRDVRSMLIIDYVAKHGEVSIKEIVPNVRGCSEKTIQRELISLVKSGKIRKIGERRWSRYSIS